MGRLRTACTGCWTSPSAKMRVGCAKAKQALRRVAARSWDSLVTAIGEVLPTITAADACAFFAKAGFPIP